MNYYTPRFLFRRHEILHHVKKGESFLEVGPGKLYLASALLNYFQTGTLVEYSPDAQSYYDRLPLDQRQRLELLISDFSTLQLNALYDCFIACEVMEHVKEDGVFLATAHSLLKDGGNLILTVPARMKYWARDDEIVGHYRRYEKEQLFTLLREHHFRDIEIISYGFPFVNLLRILRVILANQQYQKKSRWSQKKQSQESGTGQIPPWGQYFGLISNPYTVYPFAMLSSLFNKYDWSEAYLATAQK